MNFDGRYSCSVEILEVLNATFFLISRNIEGAIATALLSIIPPQIIVFTSIEIISQTKETKALKPFSSL